MKPPLVVSSGAVGFQNEHESSTKPVCGRSHEEKTIRGRRLHKSPKQKFTFSLLRNKKQCFHIIKAGFYRTFVPQTIQALTKVRVLWVFIFLKQLEEFCIENRLKHKTWTIKGCFKAQVLPPFTPILEVFFFLVLLLQSHIWSLVEHCSSEKCDDDQEEMLTFHW